MILPDKKDAVHKAWLYRILETIADDTGAVKDLRFKGGTCAAMLGWLDRFSVDLDFDYVGDTVAPRVQGVRTALQNIFTRLGLTVKDQSQNGIQYFLKYKRGEEETRFGRNTVKVEASFPVSALNTYAPQRFTEIDRILVCQTKETMFAHKLAALTDRFKKTGGIAGRDLYDIHHFFMNGYGYEVAIVEERSGVGVKKFLEDTADFIEKRVTDTIIGEDLNMLLPLETFQHMRKTLKRETLTLLRDEAARLKI